MKAKNVTIISACVALAISAAVISWVYKVGLNRPPLVFASFPSNTIEYIRLASTLVKDQGLSIAKHGPFKWDNEEDYGQTNELWSKEEDANIIVYYCRDKEAVWQTHAQDILSHANSTIEQIISVMGNYHFPEICNGRKLTIYLPPSETLYDATVSALMPQKSTNRSMGLFATNITEVGPLGCLSRGIVLNPTCFELDPSDKDYYKKTLAHEMSHYEFLQSMNYGMEIHPYAWISEGLAEFICDRHDKQIVTGVDSIDFIRKNCMLASEFPNMGNASLWAGESFFLFLERNYGISSVTDFVNKIQRHPTDSIFDYLDNSAEQLHDLWVLSLQDSLGLLPVMVPDSIASPIDSLTSDTISVTL